MAKTSGQNSQLQLVSQVFRDDGNVPIQYTCKGQNVNPPLSISGVPDGAKSLTLIMHDPDAVGSDYTHWVVYDMPASTKVIAVNSVPVGALQGQNSAGKASYMGPCPPAGTGNHRYMFELYALDITLSLKPGSSRNEVESAMKGHVLAKTVLTGMFAGD